MDLARARHGPDHVRGQSVCLFDQGTGGQPVGRLGSRRAGGVGGHCSHRDSSAECGRPHEAD
ncbi:hypothetical protein TI01_0998 [Lysobacter sp. A03]|nr:hypothetical protein TI01_0998 [Lysobacter sp. A03]